jgi:hypothetical protein
MSLASLQQEAGKIGTRNSKMPGTSYALPPSKCLIGAKLAELAGSVCHDCYAVRSERMYTSVRKGWGANYLKATRMIAEAPAKWADAMAFQIKHYSKAFREDCHRWFDAGDLQSVEMLAAIVLVCHRTPEIRHWLPTREAGIVKAWRAAGGVEPANLVIRISSTMVGDRPRNAPNTSTVHEDGAAVFGHACPASSPTHRALREDGKSNCGPCRACWDKSVANVSYPLH